MTLDPGARLGTYEILGPLGSGGMGEVYRAHDRKLGREVAIKVLSEAFASDPSRVARFEREARMLAAVNHSGIAAIYGAEEDGDFRYIVMELVEGETLSEKLAAGPLPVPEALGLAAQIAEALSVAHEKGVIHRDLKPANIKVTPEGRVKVLDLGLAKAMEMEKPASDISKSPTIVIDDSRPGNLLGTPGFMSPEQARGKETDRRADIWAFGCVLYEMLSGKRAFPGDSVPDILLAILDRQPDWSALPAATPERIQQLLRRCLEKDPNNRLRDAGDARLEIEAALAQGGGTGRVTARWKVAVAALAGAAAVAVGMYALKSTAGSARQLPDQKFVAVISVGDAAGEPTIQRIGDGFAETVRARLSNAPSLQVLPTRTAVARTEREADLRRIAREVGANLLVLISFWIQGDQVRTTYRVVNAEPGVLVKSGVVDGSLSRVFDLADRLADNVAKDLQVPPPGRRTPTPPGLETPDEWKRYLEAVGLLQRYDRRDSIEQAVAILTTLAVERPDSSLVQAALGRADLAMYDQTKERSWADRAFVAIEAARRLDPDLAEVNVTLGETLLVRGQAKEAVEAYRRAAATQPASYEALVGLGKASAAQGGDDDAEAALRRAIELQPSSMAAYSHLGALYQRRARYREAAEMFQHVTRLRPDNYAAWSNMGAALTMSGDFNSARDAYRKAFALQPTHAGAATNLGMTQLWSGRYAEAIEWLERASRDRPGDYRVWGDLGDAYRSVKGRDQDAASAYARAIKLARERLSLNPNDATAHSYLAVFLAKTGNPREGVVQIQAALALDEKDADFLFDAAVVAVLDGRQQDAIAWIRRAVDAGYSRAIVAREPEFSGLRDDPQFQELVRSAARRAA